ncbi:hypothetical protein J6590_108257 [Homalodisca vitripennis]|nr:hypothetical protein J6590_108257 [Homalodisca vitripennis]
MSDSESCESLPLQIENEAKKAIEESIPAKSRERYEGTFKKYEDWCKNMGTEDLGNEKVLIAYFNSLSKEHKPSSLWSYYSMLRSMISVNKNIDISKFSNLIALLKRTSEGYKPKKSKTFEKHHITKFLLEANDDEFLFTKVAFVIGISGACRKQELTDLTTDDVKDMGDYFHFHLPSTCTTNKVSRDFVITSGDMEGIDLVNLIRKYIKLRPKNVNHNRFFVQLRNGTCTRQPVGINTFGGLPRRIAKYLKLESPNLYTGHCLKRSSTSLLTEAVPIIFSPRHRSWKSSTNPVVASTMAEHRVTAMNEHHSGTSIETPPEGHESTISDDQYHEPVTEVYIDPSVKIKQEECESNNTSPENTIEPANSSGDEAEIGERPNIYTGHSLKRSSTLSVTDTGSNILALKRHKDWKSSTEPVAEVFLESSIKQEECESNNNSPESTMEPTISSGDETEVVDQISFKISKNQAGKVEMIMEPPLKHNINQSTTHFTASSIYFAECKNCVFNIYSK